MPSQTVVKDGIDGANIAAEVATIATRCFHLWERKKFVSELLGRVRQTIFIVIFVE
jgi:hypothetical protein